MAQKIQAVIQLEDLPAPTERQPALVKRFKKNQFSVENEWKKVTEQNEQIQEGISKI